MKKTILEITVLTAMAMMAQSTSSSTSTSPNSNPNTSTSTTTSTTATDQSGITPSSSAPAPSSTVTTQQTTTTPGTQSTSPSNPSATPDISGQSSTTPPPPSTAGSISGNASGSDPATTPKPNPATLPTSDEGTGAHASAATGQTYEGCIRERRGKYWLVTADGKRYQLNSTEDLSAHIGHEVRVTGDNSAASAGGANSAPMSEKPPNTGMEHGGKRSAGTLNATSLEMVSTNCSMDTGTTGSNPK